MSDYSPLDLAFYYNTSDQIIHYLLAHGAQLSSSKNKIPEKAIKRGNIIILKLLIDLAGCNIDAKTYDDESTALHLAIQNNQYQVVKFLLNSGASTNITDKFGFTAIHYAKHNKMKKIIGAAKNQIVR